MNFTEKEKEKAKELKEKGLNWDPKEGDWFWATETVSHQFYLGESLPSSFFFSSGEPYVFDSSMTWHIQQGGLKMDRFVWLPSWKQCRELLKQRGFRIQLNEQNGLVHLQGQKENEILKGDGETDLEAIYSLMAQGL